MQAGEGRLSELAEREGFVRLERLEPRAEAELMASADERHAIFIGEEIARDAQIASVVAAGESNLRLRIRGRAAADDHRAYRMSHEEIRERSRRECPAWVRR